MLVSEISLWGAALVAFFVLVASIALAFIDRQMLRPISTAMLVGSIVVGERAMLCLPISVFLTMYSVLMAKFSKFEQNLPSGEVNFSC